MNVRIRSASFVFAIVSLSALAWLMPAVATAGDESPDEDYERARRWLEEDAGSESGGDVSGTREDAGSSNGVGEPSIDEQIETLESEIEAESSEAAEPESPSEADSEDSPPVEAENASTADEPSSASARSFWSNWSLYRDPVLCGLVAGIVLGLLGVYVVSRRIVFVSAALSQVSALGITLGFLAVAAAGWSGLLHEWIPPAFAIALSFAVVFVLTWGGDEPSFPRDAVLGAAFVTPMALVLVLGPYIPQEMHQIESILHGSAVVVRTSDLWALGLSGAAIVATQLVAFRGFVFASLDPKVARTQGVPVGALDAILFGSIALMTGLVTRALGALPAFGLTVLPAIGALRLKIGLARVFAVAAGIGGLSGAGGYWLAYELGWSVGAAQTLVAGVLAAGTRGFGALREQLSG